MMSHKYQIYINNIRKLDSPPVIFNKIIVSMHFIKIRDIFFSNALYAMRRQGLNLGGVQTEVAFRSRNMFVSTLGPISGAAYIASRTTGVDLNLAC
jgi:hypothetical protein